MKNVSHPTSHKSLYFLKIRNLNNEVSDTELCYLWIYVSKYMLKYWFDRPRNNYIHKISGIGRFYWYGESLFDVYVIVSNRSGLPQ